MTELVRFEKVTRRYGLEPVLVNVDMSVAEGDFLGIVGPSGSGKTTLLRAIAGVVRPIAGRITRDRSSTTGYVPQVETVNWYFPVTVREAVLMGRIDGCLGRQSSAKDLRDADEVLDCLRDRRPRPPAHPRAVRRAAAAGCSWPGRCFAGRSSY